MIDLRKALKPQDRNGIVIVSEAKNLGLVLPSTPGDQQK
jgi:hypothetical protein